MDNSRSNLRLPKPYTPGASFRSIPYTFVLYNALVTWYKNMGVGVSSTQLPILHTFTMKLRDALQYADGRDRYFPHALAARAQARVDALAHAQPRPHTQVFSPKRTSAGLCRLLQCEEIPDRSALCLQCGKIAHSDKEFVRSLRSGKLHTHTYTRMPGRQVHPSNHEKKRMRSGK